MSKQLIISISREFGSGGHEIAEKLAKHYNLPLLDHNLLDEIAKFAAVNRGAFIEKLIEKEYESIVVNASKQA